MDRRTMLNRLEEDGFDVNTRFDYVDDCNIITIRKDGVATSCNYTKNDNPHDFYQYIIRRWRRVYATYRDAVAPEKYASYIDYIKDDITNTEWCFNNINRKNTRDPFEIKKVIFNPPATIVFWTDGTKTVVKAQNEDLFDYEKGLTMAIAKKAFGNQGNYFERIKKWTKDQPGIIDCTTAEVIMHDCAEHAYQRLLNALHDKKATKADLGMAMEEAVGYLGQILDD